jgi:hypothetical protein
MKLLEFLASSSSARVSIHRGRWLVVEHAPLEDVEFEFTIYERKPYQKETMHIITTYNEEEAVAVLNDD